MKNDSLGLYLHIPFCERKCYYCDFYSITDSGLLKDYINALINSIVFCSKNTTKRISSIYIGGGTPSILNNSHLFKIFDAIYHFFVVTDDCEITIEVNPNSLTNDKALYYKSIGINRISVGLQTSDVIKLKAIGRLHSTTEFENAISYIKNTGIDNYNIDLMLGIPNQNISGLIDSIKYAVSFEPKHISLYGLKIEKNTPYGKARHLKVADDDLQAIMYEKGVEYLKDNGFERYEISNFAVLEKYKSKHNLKYWNFEDYIGLGAAASGKIGHLRYQFSRSVEDYINTFVKNQHFHFSEYRILSEIDKYNEYIMLKLRTSDGITPDKRILSISNQYIDYGYMNYLNNRLSFTTKGFLISNSVLSNLII